MRRGVVMDSRTARLQELIHRHDKVLAVLHPPTAAHARLMQRAGCEALFVGTGGVVGAYTGLDDVGTASLSECLEIAGWIADSVEIPVIMALLTAPGMWRIAYASPALMSRLSAPSRSGRARRRLGGCIEIACGRV